MSSQNPENAPHNCPGTESEDAGKASACAGCPNQSICSTAPKGPDPAIEQVKQALSTVKHKILVLSGKGGVGKSTFSTQLSLALAQDEYTQVGILDIDLCGPSIPTMLGLQNEQIHQSNIGWSPAYYNDNLAVISIQFLLQAPDEAVIWRGPKKNSMIKNFLRDVYWGDTLDYMIIDTPPGTSDEHISVVTYLKSAGLDGAVLVTTPQDVACIDVRREINFCKKVGIRILGIVENMSSFVCPCCNKEKQIFRSTSGGGEGLAREYNIPFLGRIPLDQRIMKACETGENLFTAAPDSPAIKSITDIVNKIKESTKSQ